MPTNVELWYQFIDYYFANKGFASFLQVEMLLAKGQ